MLPKSGQKLSKSGRVFGKEPVAMSPALSAKQIRKLSVEEKDVLVERGELKKHSTPFGPVYKRIRRKK